MKKIYNVAIVGLGQIGSYLYKEILAKKNEIQKKTGKIIVKECSKRVFPAILTNGFGILELNLLLSPAANKIKQKLIILIYLIFM